jgi:hypothetical protein
MNKDIWLFRILPLFLGLTLVLALTGCKIRVFIGSRQWMVNIGSTATPRPTYTPNPTHTPRPTYTPMPTYTLRPTYTYLPTLTNAPTARPVSLSGKASQSDEMLAAQLPLNPPGMSVVAFPAASYSPVLPAGN